MRTYKGALCVVVGTMTMAGCGGGDAAPAPAPVPVSAQICAKADECNALQGESAAQCADRIQLCVDRLSSSRRSDWTLRANECLKLSTCTGAGSFVACYNAIPDC